MMKPKKGQFPLIGYRTESGIYCLECAQERNCTGEPIYENDAEASKHCDACNEILMFVQAGE